jgi:hypothetical protein
MRTLNIECDPLDSALDDLELDVVALESLEAPAWWKTALGVGAGVAVGYGTVALFVWT